MKQFVIFGSGYYGKLALKEIGAESIVCFIDNDKQKQGSEIDGIPIIGLEEYISTNIHYPVLVASTYIREMVEQLEKKGITDYDIYLPKRKEYKGTEVLIDNPYTTYHREASNEDKTGILIISINVLRCLIGGYHYLTTWKLKPTIVVMEDVNFAQ